MMKYFKFSFFIFLFFGCKPLELQYETTEQLSQSELARLNLSPNSSKNPLLTRSGQTNFDELFLSDKLDLIFVLDTDTKMESFYTKENFNYTFLNNFYNYDWKIAYTNMSIDPTLLSNNKTTKPVTKNSCNFLEGVLGVGLGVVADGPALFRLGFREIANCFSGKKERNPRNTITYANGSFLPFEHQSHKIYQLTKEAPFHDAIMYNSFKLPNLESKKYKAPLLLSTDHTYPMLSTMFSISQNYNSPSSSFFRDDSLVVFVLVTTQDMKLKSFPPDHFKESLDEDFRTHKRFKMIVVTLLNEGSNCPLRFQGASPPDRLIEYTRALNFPVIDICSQNLGQKISDEISKNLDSKPSLSL